MKRLIISVFILCLLFTSQAQITIQPNIPTVGLIQKNQLWNILVINNSNKQYDCRVELILRDRASGQEVITAVSGQFILGAGTKQLNINSLNPIQYTYLMPGIDNSLQGLLPAGNYNACYALTSIAFKEGSMAEECMQFDVEPLSPPMLVFPADSSKLVNAPTQFSWTTPLPGSMFNNLRYEILITEVIAGQKANEAIQENIPFYSDAFLASNFMNFPSTTAVFEKEKLYAWQIVARDDKQYAGKSEVWVFEIKKDETKINETNESYIFINSNASENNIFYLNNDQLHIKYYSFDKISDADLVIKTLEGEVVQQKKLKIAYGDNFLKIDLSKNIAKDRLYKAEIKDANNKAHTITFSIK